MTKEHHAATPDARAARLAAALKSNLARRKSQARARAVGEGGSENVQPDEAANAIRVAEPTAARLPMAATSSSPAHETAEIAPDKRRGGG
jgi:hypothetical protein